LISKYVTVILFKNRNSIFISIFIISCNIRTTFWLSIIHPSLFHHHILKFVRYSKSISNLFSTEEIITWALNEGKAKVTAQFRGAKYNSIQYKLARALVLNKIHKELGLHKCRYFYSAAAPTMRVTLEFFISLGVPLCEGYGLSESCGPHNVGLANLNKVDSIGHVNKANLSKVIIAKDAADDGCGELAIYGRHVFMGYLNDEKKTIQSFDDEGWYLGRFLRF
jgi:long-subunit acyl-CoA synthetase (AMP-forming)